MRAKRYADFLLLNEPAADAFIFPRAKGSSSFLASSFDSQLSGGPSLTAALLVGGLCAAGTAALVVSRSQPARVAGPAPEPAWVARRAQLQAELEVAGEPPKSSVIFF